MIIIVKYDNRRLFDTLNRDYVRQIDVARMIKQGEVVKVTARGTNRDITAEVLIGVLIDVQASDKVEVLSADTLHEIIRDPKAAAKLIKSVFGS